MANIQRYTLPLSRLELLRLGSLEIAEQRELGTGTPLVHGAAVVTTSWRPRTATARTIPRPSPVPTRRDAQRESLMRTLIASSSTSTLAANALRGVSKPIAKPRMLARMPAPKAKPRQSASPRTAARTTHKPVERVAVAPAPTRTTVVQRFRKLEGEIVAMLSAPTLPAAERAQLVEALAAVRSSLVELGEALPALKTPTRDDRLSRMESAIRQGDRSVDRGTATRTIGATQFVQSPAGTWDPRRGWVA